MGWVFDLPGRRGNVTAIKDDGAIELTRPIIKKLSLQDLYPPAGTHRSIAERTMGWVNHIVANGSRHCREKLCLRDLYPSGRRGNVPCRRGRLGWSMDLTSIKKDFTLEHCLPSDERADLGYSGRS
jgi:hypothetical protein